MYEPDFSGCWAKVERAKEHIDTLKETFLSLTPEPNRPRVGIKFELATGEHVVYVNRWSDTVAPVIQKCSVVIGDIVHNLRSTLDHLTFQLAMRNTTGNLQDERRVQFPIEDSPTTFERRCMATGRAGWIADLHADDRAIIERYQPYHRRDDGMTLSLIRELSDRDKHRLLAGLGIPSNYIDSAHTYTTRIANAARSPTQVRAIELGTELYQAIVPGLPIEEVEMAGHIVPVIILTESGSPPLLALAAMPQFIDVVDRLLRQFDLPLYS